MSEVLSGAQRTALEVLARAVEPSTYLAGGVAVALRLHHRQSRDLDLFTAEYDPASLVPALVDPSIRVLTRVEGTLYLEVGGVPASILRYGYPLLGPPEPLPGIPLPVASLDDLEFMKLSAIAGRGARRDFWVFTRCSRHEGAAWRRRSRPTRASMQRRIWAMWSAAWRISPTRRRSRCPEA
ncbi:hypothetical protein [Sorangium sp. So ce854]|uniref:hypothetical protein n=1 Tax=Sorangium sp. So ce854 TaxID=3133322 RepID=UPI003F62E4D1